MHDSVLLPLPSPIFRNGQFRIYVTAEPFAYWIYGNLSALAEVYFKTQFFSSLRIEDKMVGGERGVRGKEES